MTIPVGSDELDPTVTAQQREGRGPGVRDEERTLAGRTVDGKRWAWAAAALLALHAVLAWVLREPGILTAQDDSHHLILAEALRNFQYHDLFRVDAPPHSRYPPVYPALLALWGPLVGWRFDGLVALNILASTASLALIYRAVSRLWSGLLALACLAPLAVNLHLLSLAGEVRSESLYLLFTTASLVALARARPTTVSLVIAGGAAILGALTRSIGVALVAAVAIHWTLERRKVAVPVFVGVSAVLVGSWILWNFLAPEQVVGRSYAADLTFHGTTIESPGPVAVLLARVGQNAPEYFYPQLTYFLAVPNLPGTTVDNIAASVALLITLAVGALVLLRRWRPAALYLAGYAAILLVWPWVIGRFVIPVVPLVLVTAMLGLRALAVRILHGHHGAGERLGRWWASRPPTVPRLRADAVAILALSFATTIWGSARTGSRILETTGCERGSVPPDASCVWPDQASYFDALRYIDETLPADAVLLSAKSEPLYYYTRRRTAPIDQALVRPPESFIPFLRDYGTGYVLLGSLQQAEVGRLAELLEATCEALALVEVFPPRTYLLRLRQEGEPPGQDGCEAVAASRRANVGRDFSVNQ